jgi:hypothetical protein
LRGTWHSNGALRALLAIPLRAVRDLPCVSPHTTISIADHDPRLTGVEAMNPSADFSSLPGLARR